MTKLLFHSLQNWLPITANWINGQIEAIDGFEQHVLADGISDAPPPFPRLHIAPQEPTSLLTRAKQKLFQREQWRYTQLKKFTGQKLLLSHFGHRGWKDLNLPVTRHITRFYGFDLVRLPQIRPEWYERYKQLFDKCDAFIVEGPYMASLLNKIGCAQEKIHYIPFGVPVETIHFHERKIKKGLVNILCGMSFREKKGIRYALEAIGIFQQQNLQYNLHLHLIGEVPEDYLPNHLEKKRINEALDKFDLRKRTTEYGFVQHTKFLEIAQNCHFTVQPSVWAEDGDCEGGYPVSFLECMATGLPVISTDHCDIPYVVNNENGFICPEKDVAALVDSIEKMLVPGVLEKKSAAARKTVEERFNRQALGQQYSKLLHQILGS